MAMAEDDDLLEACVGRLCFVQPHAQYEPPAFHRRFARRDYRWKVGARMKTTPGLHCKLSHSMFLPDCLGLGPDARWRWQGIPVALMTSATVDILPSHQNYTNDVFDGHASFRYLGVRPRARLKALTPLFGKLALRLTVELLPTPKLVMARQFRLGTTKVTLRANMEPSTSVGSTKRSWCSLQVDWHPADTVKVMLQPVKNFFGMQYSRSIQLTPDSKGVASGVAELPANLTVFGASGLPGSVPAKLRIDSLKLSHVITDKAPKSSPLPTSEYLRASRKIGTSDLISVIPGHWIDPGYEVGAPGERDFNMEIVNILEKQLRGNGWNVLRPDRECPDLSWEEYLNWVSKQTSKGIPVLEIHGQGSKADYRGFVLGVIGDANAPLNKELAKDFGYFQMDWRDLAVPKRGGVVLESFNSDEVLQMAPWHRKWSVRRLANRITACIERASSENRLSRGIILEDDTGDDILDFDEKTKGRV
ncbi:hypothetical protein MPTK1_4g21500 [Marchantia polymorpha subsp. ruderalis]|uniref:Uncharacterized protein n=2 Tax=Marchantia polymorpha TaxID=3197 RepID=A0AAF6BCB5_MARPO|nr:hypothetical protein MARPO_0090s0071 [Marchantia polymorpha]BBN09649.1 hypothetical protein Mp_4g21500 [Marchantia polymorpha subsp. ruderalis]|eukprot:PTQ33337.1 hypothetical protein MARPO_0090s0071 [Marchantia polymorpha]